MTGLARRMAEVVAGVLGALQGVWVGAITTSGLGVTGAGMWAVIVAEAALGLRLAHAGARRLLRAPSAPGEDRLLDPVDAGGPPV